MKTEYITTKEFMTLDLLFRVRIYKDLDTMWNDHDSNTSVMVHQKQSAYIHAAYAIVSDTEARVYIPTKHNTLLVWQSERSERHKIKNKIKKGVKQKWRLYSD